MRSHSIFTVLDQGTTGGSVGAGGGSVGGGGLVGGSDVGGSDVGGSDVGGSDVGGSDVGGSIVGGSIVGGSSVEVTGSPVEVGGNVGVVLITGAIAVGVGETSDILQSGSALSMSLSPSSSLLLKQISLGRGVGSMKGASISQMVIVSKRTSASGLSRV